MSGLIHTALFFLSKILRTTPSCLIVKKLFIALDLKSWVLLVVDLLEPEPWPQTYALISCLSSIISQGPSWQKPVFWLWSRLI